jgi:hypothetical protein
MKNIAGPAQKVDLTVFQPLGTTRQRADMATVQTMGRPNTDPTPTKVMLQVIGQNNVRYTLDGSTPTPTFGFVLLAAAAPTILTYHQSTIIQVIEEGATATLVYCWGK